MYRGQMTVVSMHSFIQNEAVHPDLISIATIEVPISVLYILNSFEMDLQM